MQNEKKTELNVPSEIGLKARDGVKAGTLSLVASIALGALCVYAVPTSNLGNLTEWASANNLKVAVEGSEGSDLLVKFDTSYRAPRVASAQATMRQCSF